MYAAHFPLNNKINITSHEKTTKAYMIIVMWMCLHKHYDSACRQMR